jgi:hypothetical protein
MARPPIPIDGEQVFKLAQLGCRNQEIGDYFNCSAQTIEARFQAELDKGRSELRMTLRRWQLEAAKRGNIAMLIWLGKQMLGQIDKAELILTKIPDDVLAAEAQRRLEDGTKPQSDS